ncbi:MAG: 5-formyltetrahydrofolate cyclo-ligase [Gallionellaceae bacterium]|jgi:5-formyltetrahydrofolate cyclo-ligase|nr:5-formyltetrahydrofolate cyclo-ligase [Gallionellaceae bacterium]
MNTQNLKQALRQRIIAAREQLPVGLRARSDAEIARRIGELEAYRAARTVLGYMNFGAEFGAEMVARQTLAAGKKLLLPKVNRETRELEIYRVEDVDAQLAAGAYGIREPMPAHCEQATPDEADFILLPGVAFGRDGARLGYGGGFYDKLLARLQNTPALAAGAYSVQLADDIPQEATDRKVNWLATESETIHCNNQEGRKHGDDAQGNTGY